MHKNREPGKPDKLCDIWFCVDNFGGSFQPTVSGSVTLLPYNLLIFLSFFFLFLLCELCFLTLVFTATSRNLEGHELCRRTATFLVLYPGGRKKRDRRMGEEEGKRGQLPGGVDARAVWGGGCVLSLA